MRKWNIEDLEFVQVNFKSRPYQEGDADAPDRRERPRNQCDRFLHLLQSGVVANVISLLVDHLNFKRVSNRLA